MITDLLIRMFMKVFEPLMGGMFSALGLGNIVSGIVNGLPPVLYWMGPALNQANYFFPVRTVMAYFVLIMTLRALSLQVMTLIWLYEHIPVFGRGG